MTFQNVLPEDKILNWLADGANSELSNFDSDFYSIYSIVYIFLKIYYNQRLIETKID